MPYADYDGITQPEATQQLARYVPISKLVDLLRRRALFFTSIVKLVESDAHEGRFDQNELRQLLTNSMQSRPDGSVLLRVAEGMGVFDVYGQGVRAVFASCWYSFNTESNFMWQHYAGNDGVMLLTSVARFRRSVAGERRNINMGRMDYSGGSINYRNVFQPALRKRAGFSDEREVRALIFDPSMMRLPSGLLARIQASGQHVPTNIPELSRDPIPDGIHIECDPSILLEEIRVRPNSPEYVREAVQVVVERIGFTTSVRRSDMDD